VSAAAGAVGKGSGPIRLFGLVVSLVALLLVVRSVDVGSSAEVLRRASPLPIAFCMAIIATQVILRSVRWGLLLPRSPDGRSIQTKRIVPALLVGYLGNAVLPARLGEPIRAYLVARREELDAAEAFGSVVLERVVDTATLAVLAFLAAEAVHAESWIVQATGVAAVLGCVAMAILVVVGAGRMVAITRRLAAHVRFARPIGRLLDRLDGFARGIDRPRRSNAILFAVVISGICWVLDATIYWLVGQSVGAAVSPAAALLVGAVTVLGTALPSAPGYVGTYDLAAAITAQAFGVAAAPALALAVLAHAITVVPTAVAGVAALIGMDVRLGRLAADAVRAERLIGEGATRG
jgi:uncharacterized protein (TIRG00374 family)